MSEWLIRSSLFYSVPPSQQQESFTEHLSGHGETHTGTISCWLGIPFFSHLKAPLWLALTTPLTVFAVPSWRNQTWKNVTKHGSNAFCVKILSHFCYKSFCVRQKCHLTAYGNPVTHIIAEGSAPLIVLYSFPWLMSVTFPAWNFAVRQVFVKLLFRWQ